MFKIIFSSHFHIELLGTAEENDIGKVHTILLCISFETVYQKPRILAIANSITLPWENNLTDDIILKEW